MEILVLDLLKEKKEFSIDPNKPENFNQLYDMIFNLIKNRFEQELTKFLEKKSSEHFPEYG